MAYSYRDQLDIVKMITVQEGQRKTLNCPFCGGRSKFSVSKLDGKLLWNCYRASCSAHGSYQGQRSIDAVKNRLTKQASPTYEKRTTPLPYVTSSVYNHSAALQYLKANNCLQAVEKGLIKVRYAPSDGRVLFYTKDGCGAVGRSLERRAVKWWSYGDTSSGYSVGSGSTLVYVEDVPSACSVSRLDGYVGVAMLGTSVGGMPPIVGTYSRIVVLDNDAASKAFSLARQLGDGATIRLTKADLKSLSLCELRDVLSEPPTSTA